MYEEQTNDQREEDDIMSQLVSQIDIKPTHKDEFIPVKKTTRKPMRNTVERERQRPKINKNIAY